MGTQARNIWNFLVCIRDECICFNNLFFSFNALTTAFLCVAKSWTLSKNQMLVWPSISCYLQLPQPQAAQYFSSFLSALPIFFGIFFYFLSYFTCFVYRLIHPNISARFVQPSKYSFGYSFFNVVFHMFCLSIHSSKYFCSFLLALPIFFRISYFACFY